MLRQAQHERKILNDFSTKPVRPEPVEGRTTNTSSTFHLRNLYHERSRAMEVRASDYASKGRALFANLPFGDDHERGKPQCQNDAS